MAFAAAHCRWFVTGGLADTGLPTVALENLADAWIARMFVFATDSGKLNHYYMPSTGPLSNVVPIHRCGGLFSQSTAQRQAMSMDFS